MQINDGMRVGLTAAMKELNILINISILISWLEPSDFFLSFS